MNYNKKYAEQGLCGYCGKNKNDGFKRCLECRQKVAVSNAKTKQKHIEQGICIYCGKEKIEKDLRGCVSCNEKNRNKAKKTKEEKPDKVKEWQDKSNNSRYQNRLENELCVQCGKKSENRICNVCKSYHADAQKLYHKRHPEKAKQYRKKIRKEVIDKYGGKCECCNESLIEFLAIDHKNKDGNVERRKLSGRKSGSTPKWYLKLRREPIREDLRVLCHNCNIAIALYGSCPHKKER